MKNQIYTLLLTVLSFTINAFGASWVMVSNKTGAQISVAILDKPLDRGAVPHIKWIVLDDYENTTMAARARLLGWHQRGKPTAFTVIDVDDTSITLIEADGQIKAIHGHVRKFPVRNSHEYSVQAQVKNPQAGNVDCVKCAKDCYRRDGSTRYCACLNWCHDKTRDAHWTIDPFGAVEVEAASGSDIGVIVLDDDEDDDIVIETTKIIYY